MKSTLCTSWCKILKKWKYYHMLLSTKAGEPVIIFSILCYTQHGAWRVLAKSKLCWWNIIEAAVEKIKSAAIKAMKLLITAQSRWKMSNFSLSHRIVKNHVSSHFPPVTQELRNSYLNGNMIWTHECTLLLCLL